MAVRFATKITAAAAAAALAGAGFIGAPAAFAQTNPCGTGSNTGQTTNDGACAQQGTYTVTATLALESDLTSFTIANANINQSTPAANSTGNIFVQSTDGAGYQVTDSSTDWSDTTNSFSASDVDLYEYSPDGAPGTGTTFSNNAQPFIACTNFVSGSDCGNTPPGGKPSDYPGTGWDYWPVNGYWFTTMPNVPSGAYTATITYALWGN
jgi:hypothetical protein